MGLARADACGAVARQMSARISCLAPASRLRGRTSLSSHVSGLLVLTSHVPGPDALMTVNFQRVCEKNGGAPLGQAAPPFSALAAIAGA